MSEGKTIKTITSIPFARLTDNCVLSLDNLLRVLEIGSLETDEWQLWQASDSHGARKGIENPKFCDDE